MDDKRKTVEAEIGGAMGRIKDPTLLSNIQDLLALVRWGTAAEVAAAVAALFYVVLPPDAIPDFLPIVGWLDDAAVVAAAVAALANGIDRIRRELRDGGAA